MKNLITLFFIVLTTISCSQMQPTEFSNKSLTASLKTLDNKNITFAEILKKYSGKTIIIDTWASWCSDCVKEIPKLKELQNKYSDALFLFVSMDKTYDAWKNGINKYDLQGEHYLCTDGMKGVFGKSIKLNWIPRYMVVDKFGKIALFKAIEADDEKLIETLNKLK
ncbi:MAG TPA: alkyl hydroperoxide reductase [Flavobacterium sp.]|nr:alkyl hydroperoxide reductase [Flavobacterium sp.]